MRAALEACGDKPLVDSNTGEEIPKDQIRALLDLSDQMILRHQPILGESPVAKVRNLLWELQERVNEAYELPEAIMKRDVGEAIRKRRPLEPFVFERAWLLELFAILNGLMWMFRIARLVLRREGRAIGKDTRPAALPPACKAKEMRDLIDAFRKPRDMVVAHYFERLEEGLTVKAYFETWVSQEKLIRAHAAIDASIQGLREWHLQNGTLIERNLTEEDLLRKQSSGRSRRRRV
jgi:hypothetical protein